ncbi:unnamed protein product, partial [Pylaiella littoralis]
APDISPPRDFDERVRMGLLVAGEDAVDEDRSAAAQEKETWASGGIARARDEEGCCCWGGSDRQSSPKVIFSSPTDVNNSSTADRGNGL